jgi:serine/threonine protein kinase/tetratricopeptide (TPR) repeat protein
MIPAIGEMFGPYEILNRVGGGGMGLVFRAWDERLHREVAIKLLYDSYQMPGSKERFLQEARAASKLSHPNICTIFDIGEKDGDPFLVMELLEGETLKEKISRGALPAKEIVAYARDVVEALAAAHAKGVVHRDIKPANIFLIDLPLGGSYAKVLDFGLAKIGLAEGGGWLSRSLDVTLAGATVGTLAYMSPEQACGLSLDARSDLFSLGVVMYEMATRRVPFRGANSALIYTQLIEHEPEPIRKWNDSISRELERLILKLLSKDREDRFQNAKELRDALLQIERKLGKTLWGSKDTNAPVPLVPAMEPDAPRRRAVRPVSGAQRVNDLPAKAGDPISRGRPQSKRSSPKNKVVDSKPSSGVPQLAKSGSGANQFEFGVGPISEAAPKFASVAEPAVIRPHRSIFVGAAALIAVAGGAFLMTGSGRLRSALLKPNDTVLIAEMQNKTGDAALEGAVLEGMELDLRSSSYLKVLGISAAQAGRRMVEAEGEQASSRTLAQNLAEDVGAKAYVFGEIHTEGSQYVLNVNLLETASNDKLADFTEIVDTRAEIPGAIDHLARTLRSQAGESAGAIAGSPSELHNESTINVDALHSYFLGERSMADGRVMESLSAYQRAAELDTRFVLAEIKLAWLYRGLHAEVASSEAATKAFDSSRDAGSRLKLLAEFCAEMNASGDYSRAAATIRELNDRFADDTEGLVGLSRVLRAEGHPVDSLLAAEQAYAQGFDVDAYNEAELSLLDLNRYDDEMGLEAQSAKRGVIANRNNLAATYLSGNKDAVKKLIATPRNSAELELSPYVALYLDNSGQMRAGASTWKQMAEEAQQSRGLSSVGASLLAMGALDNALSGDCPEALELASKSKSQPRGAEAIFDTAMAGSLCGDSNAADEGLEALRPYSHSTVVAQSYLPDVKAAQMLGSQHAAEALETLESAETAENEPLTRYLRGRVEIALGQRQQAEDDLRYVLEHRGSDFLEGGDIYPAAQVELSRVSAADEGTRGGESRGLLAATRMRAAERENRSNASTE